MASIMLNVDIIKLRRFSLAFGLLLLTFSLAGVEIDSPARISPLGIPLLIKKPNLLGIGLALGSLYGLLRYGYYGVLIGLSPRKARKRLKKGTLVDGATSLNESGNLVNGELIRFSEEAYRQIDCYFPLIPEITRSEIVITEDSDGCSIELPTMPFYTRLLAYLHDVDYYAPIWINLTAILIYFLMVIIE